MNNSKLVKVTIVVVILGGLGIFIKNYRQSDTPNTNIISQNTNSNIVVQAGINIGDKAPDFSFTTVEGQETTLSSFKGQPVLFAFALTTGCASCIITAGNVLEAQKQIPFKVIQLSVSPYETPEDLLFFRETFGNSDWLIGFDKDEMVAKQYQVKAVDTTLIVDAQGKIIYREDGIPAETEDIVNVLKKSQI